MPEAGGEMEELTGGSGLTCGFCNLYSGPEHQHSNFPVRNIGEMVDLPKTLAVNLDMSP